MRVRKKLEDLCLNITDGTHSTVKDDPKGSFYLLSAKNIVNGKVQITDKERKINKETLLELRRRTRLEIHDVLITTVGTIGNVAQVEQENPVFEFQRSVAILKPNKEVVNPKYFRYLLDNNHFKRKSIGYSRGSVQKCLFLTTIRGMEVSIVENLKEQTSIAETLSYFDAKIETNNKINENLEKSGQELYKHWFVDFEFPNEKGQPYKSSGGKMLKSDLGLIPDGWKVEKLGKSSISHLVKSGIKDFSNEKVYLATADVSDTTIINHKTLIRLENKPSRANMQPKQNTVWFAKMKDSRKLIRLSTKSSNLISNYVFSTGFAGLDCRASLNYVWSFISSKEFDNIKNNMATGTTQEAINNRVINNLDFLIPTDDILGKFEKLTSDLYNKIEQNDIENLKLAEIRDLLLPKLMSGEIRVPIKE